jgi:glutathione synthase/RimK-type ligase-like ATP-grasp enzyme
MKKIALVTCRTIPEPDADQELLLGALAGAGFEARMLAWDNPVADPAEHDLCVLRSTWDYYKHPGSFLKWIERADTTSRLMNSGHVVRWNYHKRYLGELASAGVAVVPTAFFERGEEAVLRSIMETRKWDDVVIKPSVSAGSWKTKRFRKGEREAGHDFLRGLLKDRDAMVQQYMPSVEGDDGEKAIVWIDGEFTHAVRKSPRFAGSDESVSEALEISPDERTLAEQALAKVRERLGPRTQLLYGRVDLVRDAGGSLCVSEVELIEPSLFLLQHPPALERLVAAIEKYSGETMPPVEPAAPESTRSKRGGSETVKAPAVGRVLEVRKPFGRAPEPPTAADWEPKGGKSRYSKPRREKAGKWTPRDEKVSVWSPKGEESKPWKPRDEKPAGWKPGGDKPGEWKPRDKKPGEWKPRGEKSTGWKPRDGKPGEWKPRDKKPGEWKPRGEKSTGWKPRDGKPGEWKPRDKKPGEWKPRGEKSTGWKPRGEKPGEWKPRDKKPGEWKPRGEKSTGWKPRGEKPGEWKPRDKKPGEWKPRGEKPDGWKPRGPKPTGGKPGGRKFTDRKPPRRPAQ